MRLFAIVCFVIFVIFCFWFICHSFCVLDEFIPLPTVESSKNLDEFQNLPWLTPNYNNLPFCTLSDEHSKAFPKSLSDRIEWPFGSSPAKGKCIPFIDLRESEMIQFYSNTCVAKYKKEVNAWSGPNSPVY
jgi:hypothetical protein